MITTAPVTTMPPVAYYQEYNKSISESPVTLSYNSKDYFSSQFLEKNSLTPEIGLDSNGDLCMYMLYNASFFNSLDGAYTITLINSIKFIEKNNKLCNESWGINCSPNEKISDLLARQFSLLSNKAFKGILTPKESSLWANIIGYIDYRQYYLDTMSPIYIEFRVERIKDTKITVRSLVDNKRITIKKDCISSCSLLKVKDYVGAYVKINPKDEIFYIEQMSLISIDEEINIDINVIEV